jgi:hypothetical protein
MKRHALVGVINGINLGTCMTNNASEHSHKPPTEYKFQVNSDVVQNNFEPQLTGRQILELSGHKPAEGFTLDQVMPKSKPRPIQYDEIVDLSGPGIERFSAAPSKHTEG